MSERLKLANVFGWIDARYSGWRRLSAGWSDADRAVGSMLASGVRAWGYRAAVLELLPVAPLTVQSLRNMVELRVARSAQGMMLPVFLRDTYTEVEIEVSGLTSYCDAALGLPGLTVAPAIVVVEPIVRPNARHPRNRVSQIGEQLWPDGNMPPTQKAAIQAVRIEMERQNQTPPSDSTIRRGLGFRLKA